MLQEYSKITYQARHDYDRRQWLSENERQVTASQGWRAWQTNGVMHSGGRGQWSERADAMVQGVCVPAGKQKEFGSLLVAVPIKLGAGVLDKIFNGTVRVVHEKILRRRVLTVIGPETAAVAGQIT